MKRRFLLAAASSAPLIIGGCQNEIKPSRSRALDFSRPEDNLYGLMKLMGDLSGQRTYFYQPGRVFVHRDGHLPEPLINYSGATIRETRQVSETQYVTRYSGWQLFRDPLTNRVIDEWENPFADTRHRVQHFIFANRKQTFSINGFIRPEGYKGSFNWFDRPFVLPWRVLEDTVWAPYEQFSRYTNSAGHERYENAIHTYQGRLADLEDAQLTSAPATIASQSQSPYYPWMGFGDDGGHLISSSLGKKSHAVSLIPEDFQVEVERRYPGTFDQAFTDS